MLAKLLIDAIVHQTTVLIAGVSTAAGIRAPLAHVADQVFVDLSRAIEEQGVGRKVAADMFGLALRTYQKKVQRLSESSSAAHRTLWEAVLDHLEKHPDTTRQRLMKRFAVDGEDNVAAVLNDLLGSGVLERRGRGPQAVYRLSPRDDSAAALRELDRDEIATLLWVFIYRRRGATLGEIASVTGWKEEVIMAALADLCASGRIEPERAPEGVTTEATTRYRASTVTVPVGAAVGWAGAVIDHYQTVCTAIVTKLQAGSSISLPQDTVGGATLGEIATVTGWKEEVITAALADLCASGRIEPERAGDGAASAPTTRYRASTVTVPVGAAVGWAGAVIDHYQTVCTAIVTKLQAGSGISLPQDTVGGATLGFDIYPGHPHEEEVYALLRTVRGDVNRLWEKVAAHNRENPIPEAHKRKVHFYFGQMVQDAVLETTPDGAANAADEAETEVEG